MKRDARNLGGNDPTAPVAKQVGLSNRERRTTNVSRSSDYPIVLRERESRLHGEGDNKYA